MKNAVFAVFYTLGLSAFFPFFVANHKSSAALPMFLAPIVAAFLAEILARTVRLTKERNENRVVWLIAAFILLVQAGRYGLGLDATEAFTEYLALNALYQIVLVLIFAASEKRGAKAEGIGHGRLV
jgi:hypothetical protein